MLLLETSDPGFAPRNLCQNVSHQRVFEFIHNQLRASYQYFAVPPLLPGPKPRKFRSSIVSTTFYAPIVNNVKWLFKVFNNDLAWIYCIFLISACYLLQSKLTLHIPFLLILYSLFNARFYRSREPQNRVPIYSVLVLNICYGVIWGKLAFFTTSTWFEVFYIPYKE